MALPRTQPLQPLAPAPAPKYFDIFFAPDIDPSWEVNPGVLIDVSELIPSKKGTFKTYTAVTGQNLSNGNFSEASYGAVVSGTILKRVDGTGRMFAGTTKRLMENTTTGWVDVSLGGADYTTATDWQFAAYGNDVIAVSKANNSQISSTVAGAFANLGGGSPKASCITVQKNFVLMGDCDDGSNNLGDNIMWSALGNDHSWTADAATQAGNLRIRDTPGNITAMVNMRDAVAVYKEDSTYILDYQGSPLLWTARLVSDKVGCASKHGVAVVNGIHYFLHRTGVFRFDGASIQPIGQMVNRYLFDKMGSQVNYATAQAAYDEYEGVILWYFKDPGAATNERRYALAFNPETGKYGFIKNAWFTDFCRCVLKATLSDVTAWDATQATQITNLLTLGNSVTSGVLTRRPVFGNTQGNSTPAVVTGDIGNEITFTTLNRVKPRALSVAANPSFAAITVYGKDTESDDYDSGTLYSVDVARRRYDGMKSNRYLKINMPLGTRGEIGGLWLTMSTSGSE